MKTVYFVRHGQSEANVGKMILGEHSSLTQYGREQAEHISQRAARLPVDAIISSTMKRAKETAAVIATALGKTFDESDLFRERRWPSSVVGKDRTKPEVDAFMRTWFATFYTQGRVEDGENFSDIKSRAARALQYLESRPETHILVATHGFFIRIMLALVLLGDAVTPHEFFKIAQAVRTENTGISILEYYDNEKERFDEYLHKGWRVRVWNDHAHLG